MLNLRFYESMAVEVSRLAHFPKLSTCLLVTRMHLLSSCQEYLSWCGVTEVVQNVVQMDFQILFPMQSLLKEFLDSFTKVLKLFGGLPSNRNDCPAE